MLMQYVNYSLIVVIGRYTVLRSLLPYLHCEQISPGGRLEIILVISNKYGNTCNCIVHMRTCTVEPYFKTDY